MFKKRHGFTLIELMVVIVIIGILATLGLATYQNAVRKARDSKRIGDLKDIAAAQEQYRSLNGSYVNIGAGNGIDDGSCIAGSVISDYEVPSDPLNNGTYTYKCRYGTTSYCVEAQLEAGAGGNCGGGACVGCTPGNICEPESGTTHYCVWNKY